MPGVPRRSPRRRLLLTLAALSSLIGGYYIGQYWQRQPLAGLSAVVYPQGRPIDYPASLPLQHAPDQWRLFLVADTRQAACGELLRQHARVINRLAASPSIQRRLRLTLLAYDRPDEAAISAFSGGVNWAEVVSGEVPLLDRLSEQLGILPLGADWCTGPQASAVLVDPKQLAWALIPDESPPAMAHNIRTIIEFVE